LRRHGFPPNQSEPLFVKIRISAVMPSGHLCGLVDRREMEGGGASKKIAASSLAAIANGEKIQ